MDDDEIQGGVSQVIILGILLFFMFRPEGGYLQRLEFLKFLIENGILLENIFLFEVFSLLVLFPIFISLYIFRNPLGRAISRSMYSLMANDLIKEFDKNDDSQLSKEEAKGLIDTILEDLEESARISFDSDTLFEKHDSDKDGKLNGNELTSLILELFAQELAHSNQESPSADEPVAVGSGEDEMQKLDRLYNEGYLSKERYERLKQDLSR